MGFRKALLVVASAVAAGGASAASDDARVVREVSTGVLQLQVVDGPLQRLGVRVDGQPDAFGRLPLALTGALELALDDGAPTDVLDGRLSVPALRLIREDGARSPPLSLAAGAGEGLQFALVDAKGAVWLRLSHPMRSPDVRNDGLRLFTADLRVGPALAAWSGRGFDGALFAGASLRAPMLAPLQKIVSGKSCAAPNWPGTTGFVTDVLLTSIDSIDTMRCRGQGGSGSCDGPGGLVEDELVVVPSTTLRNSTAANASEVPWYTRLSGTFAPYGNDQHPFLVWNLYRISADGRLEQIARSGLKHAFATENLNCSEPCHDGHILGRGCQDRYNAFSNDANTLLAPRSEVVAASGLWGRCGSVFDGDCDGAMNSLPADIGDPYRDRMRVRESDVDAAANPGARWFVDSWYVIRDDADIHNTMGYRPVTLSHGASGWQASLTGGHASGSVLDAWLADAAPQLSHRAVLATPEGEAAVAVRVTRESASRYRYDYAVMNFEFARATISGSEPNLVVHDNRGFDRLGLSTATALATSFSDGDGATGNDWPTQFGAGELQWTAPAGNSLDWGSLYSFRLVAAAPPVAGTLRLHVAAGGSPAEYSVDSLVPDPAWIFASGFD